MKIRQKGLISIPQHLLEHYGLKEGDEVELVPLLDAIMLRRAGPKKRDLSSVRGVLKGRALTEATDEYMQEVRGR